MPSPRKRPGLCWEPRFPLQSRVMFALLAFLRKHLLQQLWILPYNGHLNFFLKQNIKHLVNQSNYSFPRNTGKSTLFLESREKHIKYPISLFGKKTFQKRQGNLQLFINLFSFPFFILKSYFFSMPRWTLETQQKKSDKILPLMELRVELQTGMSKISNTHSGWKVIRVKEKRESGQWGARVGVCVILDREVGRWDLSQGLKEAKDRLLE